MGIKQRYISEDSWAWKKLQKIKEDKDDAYRRGDMVRYRDLLHSYQVLYAACLFGGIAGGPESGPGGTKAKLSIPRPTRKSRAPRPDKESDMIKSLAEAKWDVVINQRNKLFWWTAFTEDDLGISIVAIESSRVSRSSQLAAGNWKYFAAKNGINDYKITVKK